MIVEDEGCTSISKSIAYYMGGKVEGKHSRDHKCRKGCKMSEDSWICDLLRELAVHQGDHLRTPPFSEISPRGTPPEPGAVLTIP